MKTITLLRSFAIFVALVIFAGCSKDNLLAPPGDNFAKSVKIPETHPPSYCDGGIKGILTPVPYIVSIKLYNDAGFYAANTPNTDGSFMMDYICPGIYNMNIYYVPDPKNPNAVHYIIWGIEVKEGEITSLGEIKLP